MNRKQRYKSPNNNLYFFMIVDGDTPETLGIIYAILPNTSYFTQSSNMDDLINIAIPALVATIESV